MDHVEKFLTAYAKAKTSPTEENLQNLIECLLPFAPAGIEWGIEISSIAGVTYMLEGGRVVAVKVSRDEFGPFMQTSVASIPISSVPAGVFKNIRDVDAFVKKTAEHLAEWAKKAPKNSSQRILVEALLASLNEVFRRD